MNTFNQFSSPKVSFALSSMGEYDSVMKKETHIAKINTRKVSIRQLDDQGTTLMYTPNDSLLENEMITNLNSLNIKEIKEAKNIKDHSISTIEKVFASPYTENFAGPSSKLNKGSILKFNGGCFKNKAFKRRLNFDSDTNKEESKALPVIPEKETICVNFN